MLKLGLRPRNSFSRIVCFEFLVFCLCSASFHHGKLSFHLSVKKCQVANQEFNEILHKEDTSDFNADILDQMAKDSQKGRLKVRKPEKNQKGIRRAVRVLFIVNIIKTA